MRSFSIIIPTLNEAENIAPILTRIEKNTQPHGLDAEIIFVDDGSLDGTRTCIENYQGGLSVRLLCRDNERGLTGAVIAGAGLASNDAILVMDADLSHPPEMIQSLIMPVLENHYDMVIGSRYVTGGDTPNWPLKRRLGSRVASFPAQILTGVNDPLAGFFAVRKKYITALTHGTSGFKIGLELLAQNVGALRVQELPITFIDRTQGASKMSSRILGEYLKQLMRLYTEHQTFGQWRLLLLLAGAAGLIDCGLYSFFQRLMGDVSGSHIASFLTAGGASFALYHVFLRRRTEKVSRQFGGFLTVFILFLFLRGGLLAPFISTFDQSGTWPLYCVLFFSIFISWLAAILLSTIYGQMPGNMRWPMTSAALLLYSLVLRLVYLGGPALMQEEAYYWNYAQHPATGYLDHPPMVAVLIQAGTFLFGQNEVGVRLFAFFSWFITAFFTYRLSQAVTTREGGSNALVLLSVLPIYFGVAIFITPDAPLIACWSALLYYLYRALVAESPSAWLGVGIALGLGMASKYSIAFLSPGILFFMVTDSSARRWLLRPHPYLAAILALFLFVPVIWWNYHNDWASFLFQSQGRLQAHTKFSSHLLILSIALLLAPTGFLAAIDALWTLRPRAISSLFYGNRDQRNSLFCFAMVLGPLAVFTLFSLSKEVKLNWTGPLWLALLPMIAVSMQDARNRFGNFIKRLWPGTLLVLVFLYGVFFHYLSLGFPLLPYGKNVFLTGWEDLSAKIETKAEAAAAQSHRLPIIVAMDSYRTASGLAFYLAKAHSGQSPLEVTAYHLFGHNALMYKYWFSPEQARGRDLLIVSEDYKRMDPRYFADFCKGYSEVNEIISSRKGRESGRVYYRMLFNYSPDPLKKLGS